MKNYVWIIIGICTFSCYLTFMSANGGRQLESVLNLSDVEALAFGEDFGITCGSPENKGRCWKGDCDKTCWTAFGFYKCYSCPTATGSPNDVCIEDVPC